MAAAAGLAVFIILGQLPRLVALQVAHLFILPQLAVTGMLEQIPVAVTADL